MNQPANSKATFPKRFFWGAATSAHQVEGGNHNQWSVWELEHAKVLAEQAKYRYKHLENWPKIKPQATDPANYISGPAADHYRRYKEDFDLLKELNCNAFRFSIEWSRIEPEEGVWDAGAIEHYRSYLQELKKRSIEPIVTLWHWTLPVWFAKKGGFEKRRNTKYFIRFVDKVLEELGRDFRYVITLNEVETYIHEGYRQAAWPPMQQKKLPAFWVYTNLIRAHRRAYRLIKKSSRKFVVGISANIPHIYPGDDARLTRMVAKIAAWVSRWMVVGRVRRQLDFVGLNFYYSDRYYGYRVHNPDQQLSDTGVDMQPRDIQYVLELLYQKYKLPIIVTENGCADANDQFRKWWLTQTVLGMLAAVQNGVRLEGYLHWSLLDNFEWASGFWPRYGLVAVEPKTGARHIRPSAAWFAKTISKL